MAAPHQKVVIPRGLVNPQETTIIEIPQELRNVCTVVAKPKIGGGAFTESKLRDWSVNSISTPPGSPGTPPGGKLIKKSSYLRRTFPKASVPRRGMLHDAGTTFAGRDYDSADESSVAVVPPVPHTPKLPNPPLNYLQFTPKGQHSTPKPYVDMNASSALDQTDLMYCSFRPPRGSSLQDNHPAPPGLRPQRHTPGSLRRYQSSSPETSSSYAYPTQSSPEASSSYAYPTQSSSGSYHRYPTQSSDDASGAYYRYPTQSSHEESTSYRKTSVTTELPDGKISQTEFEEESFGTPGSSWETPENLKTCNLTPWSSSEETPSSPRGAASPQNQLTQGDLMTSVGELESQELHRIMGDLNDFQNARRRLVFDASSLASAADVSSSLMSGTPPHGATF